MSRPRLLLWAMLAIIQWGWFVKAVPQLHGNDFGIFYRSAASATPYSGHAGNPTTESGQLLTNLNPPHFLPIVEPFTALPFWPAATVWWALSLALLAAGLTWWLRTQGECWTPERIVWALLWAPLLTVGFTGQVTAVVGVPLWLAYTHLTSDRTWKQPVGGFFAGLVLSVKPILWPLGAWYVIRRAWPTVAGMAIGVIVAVGAGVALFGVEMYAAWLHALRGIQWGPQVMNASIAGIVSRLPFETPTVLSAVIGIALCVLTIWRMRAQRIECAWMPLVAASLLASPLGWIYYGVWLLPGTRVTEWTRGIALGWCAPMLVVALIGNMAPALWPTLGSCYGWTLLALWFRAVTRSPRPISASTTQLGSWYEALHPSTMSR